MKTHALLMLSLTLVLLSPGTTVQGAVWYVRSDAAPGGDGTSWHTAFKTIQEAVNWATSWDEVWVKEGTYKLESQITIVDKGPSVYGGFKGTESERDQRDWKENVTTVDGQKKTRCLYIAGIATSLARIDGLTITNGNTGGDGGGICIDPGAFPTIANCVIAGNSSGGYGGGVFNNRVATIITNCIFLRNHADSEGGAVGNLDSGLVITNCTFFGNHGWNGGGVSGRLLACPTFTITMTNCTFYKNNAQYNGGAISNLGGTTIATNCILWANTAGTSGPQAYNYFEASFLTLQYSDVMALSSGGVSGGVTITGSIDKDPKLVSPDIGNFRLRPSSPCIDTGNNAAPHIQPTDIDGNERIIDGNGDATATVDMGAYEHVPGGPVYGVWFVDFSKPTSGDGTSWDQAFNNIPEAIPLTIPGDEIWVKQGTCNLTKQITIDKAVPIYGGFDGTEMNKEQRDWQSNVTTLNCQSMSRCLYITSHPIVDGFTITGGYDGGDGGGIYIATNARPTIQNCAVYSNTAGNSGGGISATRSTPTITNCTITDNRAQKLYGGGIYTYESSAIITDCTITNNRATRQWYGYGGGISNHGLTNSSATVTITGCSIADNEAYYAGGVYNIYNSATLTNCTIIENKAGRIGAGIMNVYAKTVTISSCLIGANETLPGDGDNGGGIYNEKCNPTILNCAFIANKARRTGGAIHNYAASPTVINCTIAANYALYGGGGIATMEGTPIITNCILWQNTAGGQIWHYDPGGSLPVVTYCNVQGGTGQAWFGTGCIDTDPLFADPDGPDDDPATWADNDFHLSAGSLCIDSADNTAVPPSVVRDLAGNSRFVDDPATPDTGNCGDPCILPIVDMGAYEFAPEPLQGDFNADKNIDLLDFCVLGLAWSAKSGDANWNPLCDISQPPDDVINMLDFAVFVDHWLEHFE